MATHSTSWRLWQRTVIPHSLNPSQHKATCLALYYCIRAISCNAPFITAYTNITFHFERNKEELTRIQPLSFSLPRKQSITFLTCHFIHLHYLLSCNAVSAEFKSTLSRFQDSLQWCLEHDYLTTPLLFRMLIIQVFAASDCWRYLRDPSAWSRWRITHRPVSVVLPHSLLPHRVDSAPLLHHHPHSIHGDSFSSLEAA